MRKSEVSGSRILAPSCRNSTLTGRLHGTVWFSLAGMRLDKTCVLDGSEHAASASRMAGI
jgi:hypothetical protein